MLSYDIEVEIGDDLLQIKCILFSLTGVPPDEQSLTGFTPNERAITVFVFPSFVIDPFHSRTKCLCHL